jgi:hypothetical protein
VLRIFFFVTDAIAKKLERLSVETGPKVIIKENFKKSILN